jgi:transmembrane sensor
MIDRPAPSQAEREASRWIARLEAEDVSLEDHQRFRAWLKASDENERAYRALSRTWDTLDALRFEPAAQMESPIRRSFLVAGAGALLAGAVGAALYVSASSPSEAASFAAPVGGRRHIVLGDGSQLDLNAAAALDVALSDRLRSVTLERGEAYFNVAADPRRFAVKTPYGAFSGRGVFVIKLLADGARASVVEGELRAEPHGPLAFLQSVSIASSQEVLLAPDMSQRSDLTPDQIHNRSAWRQGLLIFDGDTLGEAVLEIERQTGQRFIFADSSLREMRIGGQIAADDKDGFVALLRDNLGLLTTAEGDTLVLSR